jgi:hypothetical protein
MKLKLYALTPTPPKLVPAAPDRPWMDAFPARHAYRCLPLAIANTYGWEVLSPYSFSIRYNGGPRAEDISIKAHGDAPQLSHFVTSNFTHGIVTFHLGYLFRTEPGWHTLATGPLNRPKDGISPLSGVIETDWLPYPFTMNWQLTRPGVVKFEEGEPVCQVFPVPAGALSAVQPELWDIADDPELEAQYKAWREKREEFMVRFRAHDPDTLKQAWQRFYFKGEYPDGTPTEAPHTHKLRLAAPTDLRKPSR